MVELLKHVPPGLVKLTHRLTKENSGAEVYLVGGAVRDLLLSRATKDYDLVVRGVAADTLEQWLGSRGQVALVGKTFGVFKWQPEGWTEEAIDVALPRTEHVTSGTGQYRDFTIQSDPTLPIESDLTRRDFTINALALNISTGELVDPHQGQADLKSKTLRTVGDSAVRFLEDLSRTLRGLRFACQLDFEIEAQTWAAIQELAKRTALGTVEEGDVYLVPREIIARELLKALVANPVHALELLDESGFLNHLLPEVVAMKNCPQAPQFHSEGDVFEHTKLALAALSSPAWKTFFDATKPSLNAIVAVLLHDIGKPLTLKTPERDGTDRIRTNEHDTVGAELVPKICERLKLTSYVDPKAGHIDVEAVSWLVKHHLVIFHGPTETLKPSTIYRYFLKDPTLGLELQQLIFADSWSTRPQDGRDLTVTLKQFRPRVAEVEQKLTVGKLKLLLSGTEIMKHFKLTPGPKIGELLQALEEAQLESKVKSKDEALTYLQTLL